MKREDIKPGYRYLIAIGDNAPFVGTVRHVGQTQAYVAPDDNGFPMYVGLDSFVKEVV